MSVWPTCGTNGHDCPVPCDGRCQPTPDTQPDLFETSNPPNPPDLFETSNPSNPRVSRVSRVSDPGKVVRKRKSPSDLSPSDLLADIAQKLYQFGVSTDGESYGVPVTGAKVVLLLRGGKTSLRAQLAAEYRRKHRKVAPKDALGNVMLLIEGLAQEAEPVPLHLRVANHDGALWLDLGDLTGRAIEVTEAGWFLRESAPVLFKRTALTRALPEPVTGASIDELWSWLNITEADRPLIAATLVAMLWPGIPHPVIGLTGEQGTAKTTATRVIASVLDPSAVPCRKTPKNAEAWVTGASGSWVVGLDNLGWLPDWLSDSICRAVTGDGDVRRKLYSDGDLVVFAFRRCVIVNGIDFGALRGDLADRMLSIELEMIDDERRLEEREFWAGWADAHPRILGAVLDLAAASQKALHSVDLKNKPRMADFARILAAVDKVRGTNGLARYLDKQAGLAVDSLTGDPLVTAMAAKLTAPFTGTATELLDMLTPALSWREPKGWPQNARQLTTRLRRQAPVMRKAGWSVSDDGGANHQNTVRWTIARPTRESRESRESQIPAKSLGRESEGSPLCRPEEQGENGGLRPHPGRRWTIATPNDFAGISDSRDSRDSRPVFAPLGKPAQPVQEDDPQLAPRGGTDITGEATATAAGVEQGQEHPHPHRAPEAALAHTAYCRTCGQRLLHDDSKERGYCERCRLATVQAAA